MCIFKPQGQVTSLSIDAMCCFEGDQVINVNKSTTLKYNDSQTVLIKFPESIAQQSIVPTSHKHYWIAKIYKVYYVNLICNMLWQSTEYCKPTFFRDYFISRFTLNWFMVSNFHDRAFLINIDTYSKIGLQHEIFVTMRFSQIS